MRSVIYSYYVQLYSYFLHLTDAGRGADEVVSGGTCVPRRVDGHQLRLRQLQFLPAVSQHAHQPARLALDHFILAPVCVRHDRACGERNVKIRQDKIQTLLTAREKRRDPEGSKRTGGERKVSRDCGAGFRWRSGGGRAAGGGERVGWEQRRSLGSFGSSLSHVA